MKWYNVHFYKIMKPEFSVNIFFLHVFAKVA